LYVVLAGEGETIMRVELAGQKISFPSQCTCCGEPPNADNYIASAAQNSTTHHWQFPLCDQCQAHLAIAQNGGEIGVALFCCIGVGGLYLMSWLSFGVGFLVAFAWIYLTEKKAKAALCPTYSTTGPPATFEKWQGTLQVFDIKSDVYATAFLRENASKAVNLTTQERTALAGTNADLTSQSVR
jgi:hypothetical protein